MQGSLRCLFHCPSPVYLASLFLSRSLKGATTHSHTHTVSDTLRHWGAVSTRSARQVPRCRSGGDNSTHWDPHTNLPDHKRHTAQRNTHLDKCTCGQRVWRLGWGDASGVLQFLQKSEGTPQLLLAISSLSSQWAERVSASVCLSVSVCRTEIAKLSQRGEGSQVCVYVCVVPSGETEANSRKWIGMEDLARDSGVKMKEFLHTQTLSLPLCHSPSCLLLSLSSLLLDALYLCHLGFTSTCSYANLKPEKCTATHPRTCIRINTPVEKPKNDHQIFTVCTL